MAEMNEFGKLTPCYVYDASMITDACRELKQAFPDFEFLYSIKTNPFAPVVRTIAAEGFGADAASANEVDKALAAGMPAGDVYFSAPGRTPEDIRRLLESGSEAGRFCALCTRTLQQYYHRLYGKDSFGVVDSMLLTAALYPEVMEDLYEANCAVELQGTETHGYFRIDRYGRLKKEPNAVICPRINAAAYKERLFALLCGK